VARFKLHRGLTVTCFEIGNKNIPPIRWRIPFDDSANLNSLTKRETTMAYITISNAQHIIYKTDIKSLDLKGTVYKKKIFFFSKFEENSLLAIQELLKDPEKFITEIYKPIVVKDTYKFVYEGKPPAYHKAIDCPRISANYKNFEIPEAIREKGIDEIIRFRKWFEENKHLLDKPDVFVMRLELRWGIVTNPKEIKRYNSGWTEVENYKLEELEQKIDDLLREAGRYYYASQKNTTILKRFNKYTFLAYRDEPIDNNDTGYPDNEVKALLKEYNDKIKKPLKRLLIEYYRLTLNPDLKLEGNLLDQLGFKPCGQCYDEYNITEPLTLTNLPDNNDDLPF